MNRNGVNVTSKLNTMVCIPTTKTLLQWYEDNEQDLNNIFTILQDNTTTNHISFEHMVEYIYNQSKKK